MNILGHEQEAISQRFAGKDVEQFRDISTSAGYRRCPIIDGVSAFLESAVVTEFVVGTHTVVIGRVVGGDVRHTRPAAYHDGGLQADPL